jgi:hypothetical protein
MTGLHTTKLAEGEEILFGPSRKASTTNLSVKSEQEPDEVTHTTFRTVCITNQRVIIEAGDSALTYPNTDVDTVIIKRNSGKKTKIASFNILQIRTYRGNSVKIEIPGVGTEKEPLLAQTFPNASITESRGLNGFLDRVLGG